MNEEFNEINIDISNFNYKKNTKFKELSNIKKIVHTAILEGCILNLNILYNRGKRRDGWGFPRWGPVHSEYYPPEGYIGYGLNIIGKYDNGKNEWLDWNGLPFEWPIAYYNMSNMINEEDKIFLKVSPIIKMGFNILNKEKINNKVFCNFKPEILDSKINNKYIFGFEVRIRPDKFI